MNTRFKFLKINDVVVFSPNKFNDARGVFFENINFNDLFNATNYRFNTIQENISISNSNTLRGLHFQKGASAQSKIVSVIKGSILDIVVDVRPQSETFAEWISYRLDDQSNESLFIPVGFAHGFYVLEDKSMVSYKVDKPYDVSAECSILWNDKQLDIKWPNKSPLLSPKDEKALTFKENLDNNNFDSKGYFKI